MRLVNNWSCGGSGVAIDGMYNDRSGMIREHSLYIPILRVELNQTEAIINFTFNCEEFHIKNLNTSNFDFNNPHIFSDGIRWTNE